MGPVSIGVEVQRNTDGDTPSTIHVAKTKALISCAVTAQLSSVFVFACAKKKRFSHDTAQLIQWFKIASSNFSLDMRRHVLANANTKAHNATDQGYCYIYLCCLYSIIHLASIYVKLQASSGCFWCQSFRDISPYIIFSSVLIVEWPSYVR